MLMNNTKCFRFRLYDSKFIAPILSKSQHFYIKQNHNSNHTIMKAKVVTLLSNLTTLKIIQKLTT